MAIYKTAPSYDLRIHNPATLEVIQDVVNFVSFSWSRHAWHMGDFTLVVHRDDIISSAVGHDKIVSFRRGGQYEFVGIIRRCEYIADTGIWTFTGFDLKWFLKTRTVIPPAQTPANAVQSWACGTPTAGTYTLRIPKYEGSSETTATINFDADIATIQAAIDLVLEDDETITVGGTAPTSGGPVTFTYSGSYAQRNVELIEVRGNSAFDGGLSVTHTTVGTPPRAYYDTVTSVAAETAMRYYVLNHLGSSAVADSAGERDLNAFLDGITFDFAQSVDAERGDTVTYNARYQNLLTEVLEQIARATDTYYDITIDEGASGGYRFHVYEITDVSTLQTNNDQVIFGTEFGNATDTVYTNDRSGEITLTYILSPERLDYRPLELEDINGHAHTDHTPSIFRIETVFDGRDDLTSEERHDDAHVLMHGSVAENLSSTPIDAPLVSGYRVNWDIGYKVTVSLPRVNLTQHLTVTGVDGTYDASSGESIRVSFGDPPPAIEDVLSHNFTQINRSRFAG